MRTRLYKPRCSRLVSDSNYHSPSPCIVSIILAHPILRIFALLVLCCCYLPKLYKALNRWWLRPAGLPRIGDSPDIGTVAPDKPSATETPIATIYPSLPPELLERISDFLFQPIPPVPDPSGTTSVLCFKPSWNDVAGFMGASPSLHRMGFRRWLQIVSVKSADDWKVIIANIELIREIHCFDGTLLDPKHQDTLSKIPNLYAALIDAHSDVWHDEHNRFAYRDILSTLPPSLKRLEIEYAHGPDIRIISLVKKHCPRLEELILGRCTMFNRYPACDFWASFPHDHDAYMSNTGTDAYAHSLANELAPLKHLRSLRVGLYFVPSDIVLAHRLYHRRNLPAPENIEWQSAIPLAALPANPPPEEIPPHVDLATTAQLVSLLHSRDDDSRAEFKCPRCIEITDVSGREAENSASSILREYLPTLTSVEWMGWLTPQHIGVNSYLFSPRMD